MRICPHSKITTNSKVFRMRDEPAIALYDAGTEGSLRDDFNKGRKEQASRVGVIEP